MKKRTFFSCASATVFSPAFLSKIDAQVVQEKTDADDSNKSMILFDVLRGARAVGWSMWDSWQLETEDRIVIYKFTISNGTAKRHGVAIIASSDGGRVLVNMKQLSSSNVPRTTMNLIEAWPTPSWLNNLVRSIEKGVDELDPLKSKISGSGLCESEIKIIRSEKLGRRIFDIIPVGLTKPVESLCKNIMELCEKINFGR